MINDGYGYFDRVSYSTEISGHSSAVSGDYTGDGIVDVILTSAPNDSMIIMAGRPRDDSLDAYLGPPGLKEIQGEPTHIVTGDFTRNGLADILVVTYDSGKISLSEGIYDMHVDTNIHLVSPNGGHTLISGTDYPIVWTKDPGVLSVNIEFSKDNGRSWRRLASNISGTTFTWRVPVVSADSVLIRIYDPTVSGRYDMSDLVFTIDCCELRGDVKHDNHIIMVDDIVYLVNYIFKGGPPPICSEEGDVLADNGLVLVNDVVFLVNHLFKGGPPPVPCP